MTAREGYRPAKSSAPMAGPPGPSPIARRWTRRRWTNEARSVPYRYAYAAFTLHCRVWLGRVHAEVFRDRYCSMVYRQGQYTWLAGAHAPEAACALTCLAWSRDNVGRGTRLDTLLLGAALRCLELNGFELTQEELFVAWDWLVSEGDAFLPDGSPRHLADIWARYLLGRVFGAVPTEVS